MKEREALKDILAEINETPKEVNPGVVLKVVRHMAMKGLEADE